MHENSSLCLESPFIHTGTIHALQEAHHLHILEDEFSRKTFFLPQTPSERCPACECSCLQPQRILQPNLHIPQGRALHGTNPQAILASARENLHHGCWEGSFPVETSGMLDTEERAPNKAANSNCGHGDNAGTQTHMQDITELPQHTANNQYGTVFYTSQSLH